MAKKREYTNKWTFNGKPVESEDVKDFEAFCYLIEVPDNGLYIGRKNLISRTKSPGAKRRSKKESDWQHYYSSSDEIKDYVKEHGTDGVKRIILSFHKTAGDANIQEQSLQWKLDVLQNAEFINRNIGGKFHSQPQKTIDARLVSDKLGELLTEFR